MKYTLLTIALLLALAPLAQAQEFTTRTQTGNVVQENNTLVEVGDQSQANINQQNTVIHHQPTPTPEPLIPNEHISVSITDNRQTVRPGDELNYRITVRNHIHEDLDNLLIRLEVPKFYIPAATEPEANTTDPERRIIEWKHQQVSAGSEVSFTLRGHAENGAPDRSELLASVLVNGPGVHHTAHDQTIIVSGAIAGATTSSSTGQTITVVEPAAVDVKPTAPTGPGQLAAVGSIVSIITGFIGTRRFITR